MASESHLHPTFSSSSHPPPPPPPPPPPWVSPSSSLFSSRSATMSRNGKGPRLELKLNLQPPLQGDTSRRRTDDNDNDVSPNFSSSPSSCVSSEAANSPDATSMVLAGCPRCLMYVMLAEEDPRCPRCKSTVLLDFLNNSNIDDDDDNNNNNGNGKKKKKNKRS